MAKIVNQVRVRCQYVLVVVWFNSCLLPRSIPPNKISCAPSLLLVPDVLIPWVPVQLWNKDQLVQLEEYGVQSKGDNKVRVHPTFHALF